MKLRTARADVSLRTAVSDDVPALLGLVWSSKSHLTAHGDYEDLIRMDAPAMLAQLASGPLGTPAVSSFVMLLRHEVAGLASLIHHKPDVAGLGYWIGAAFSRQGITGAAVAALVAHAQNTLGAKEVWAGIRASNEPSIRLVRRLGFHEARRADTHISFLLRTNTLE